VNPKIIHPEVSRLKIFPFLLVIHKVDEASLLTTLTILFLYG